jgi:hypothetical protein
LRCNHYIKHKKKKLLHERAKPLPPLVNTLNPFFVKNYLKFTQKKFIKFFIYFTPYIKNGFLKINLLYNIIKNYIKISNL